MSPLFAVGGDIVKEIQVVLIDAKKPTRINLSESKFLTLLLIKGIIEKMYIRIFFQTSMDDYLLVKPNLTFDKSAFYVRFDDWRLIGFSD